MNSAITPPPANILVVDDTPENLELLTCVLKERGYKVRPVSDGESALHAAQAAPPDLILLDITMPEMDGYEVCARLKADERLRDIPVLFISALAEPMDKVRAFEAGGVDYVTKPFNFEEVGARVRTHLELRRQQRQLSQQNQELAASLARLHEIERLRDSLTHMMAHDMRSPLLAIQLSLDLLAPVNPEPDAMRAEMWRGARASAATIVEMIGQMIDVSRMEAGALQLKLATGNLVETVRSAVEAQRLLAGTQRLIFAAGEPVMARFDGDLLRRVVGNLIGNAIKFSAADGAVRVWIAGDLVVVLKHCTLTLTLAGSSWRSPTWALI